jgi:hypothetical protein
MTDPYAACPVDRTSREIRLLKLQPKNDEGIIKCDMQTYSQEDRPPYAALSYTWGPDTIYTDIEINGAKVPVRENLWDFLSQQLLQSNYGPFWIDALCIQQADVDERSHQVRMMRSIYLKAAKVMIWLGKEGDDSDIAMDLLENQDTVRWIHSPYTLDKESGRLIPTMLGSQRLSLVEECSIKSLFKREYWSRMWIIQEVMLASYLDLHCGSKIVPVSKLVLALEDIASAVTYYSLEDASFRDSLLASPAMTIVKEFVASPHRNEQFTALVSATLPNLLEAFGDHECGDIRDKVYALSGMAEYGPNINIDYRKSTKEVLIDVLYHEGNRMKFETRHYTYAAYLPDRDALLKFAQLLGRVLEVPLPEAEVEFHVNQCESIPMFKDWENWKPTDDEILLKTVPSQEES